jgi:hypothetical protein
MSEGKPDPRHVDVAGLVFGVVFCGGALVATMVQAGQIGAGQVRWMLPGILILAGLVGLVAGSRR